MNMEEKMNVSESPPTKTTFSSLPYDVALDCLARISRIHHPTLFLVSKTFRSILASPDLDATRSRIGKTEKCLYVCLDLNKNNPNPRWFTLGPIPTQQKLLPIPSFTYQHCKNSTVVSIGSQIYIIGGSNRKRISRRVSILDCPSHQWRKLQEMRVPRVNAAVDVIDGKIHVLGGRRRYNDDNIENWGEVYEPKTQTWEPLSPKTLDLTFQKSLVPDRLVMSGRVHACDRFLKSRICLVEIEKTLCQTWVTDGDLFWYDPKENLRWSEVEGLEGLSSEPYLDSVANSDDARRLIVWWKSVKNCHDSDDHPHHNNTEIWCAEISFERRDFGKLWGFVEWSKNVFSLDGCDDVGSNFLLHSAMVTL